ncbi:hypothetical protein OB2597_07705 [Pseudooceanicola batsensis HTCC2597]|uniref:MOSC domain-containing protein n=1 Tax=Pseudooceanicola batsensis (strain ATCC BAA-863 / DSM 15984 / KCTC 12145 / HTCC2597) TaxID=252305 RepID=A3TU26_PSEBH|nr:MOSC N-terminal beta barrel domain-containing protein [Pseudooceanicola batsensis]EAQ05153.1 hypothetical protein OB2597_07705 [Pseudooceanicola batsensis HTCC2597]
MPRLARIFRHPIKGIGSEPLESAELTPAGALTGDRAWALLNADAPQTDDWQPRRNFLVVARGPALAAVTATSVGQKIRLTHPDRPPLDFDPAAEADALREWVAPLWPAGYPAPARLVRAPGHGMTDMPDAYVSIGSLASLRAFEAAAGQQLDLRRFRINLWLEDLDPWEETGWIGRQIMIGTTRLDVSEPIGRCRAPEASPETGQRDVNTNRILTDIGKKTDFGVYARVVYGGTVATGDTAALL